MITERTLDPNSRNSTEAIAARRPLYRAPKDLSPEKGHGGETVKRVLCAFLCLTAVGALLGVAAAKSGVIVVPYLSSSIYTGPVPIREVIPATASAKDLLARVGGVIMRAVTSTQASAKNVSAQEQEIAYTESELTALARTALFGAGEKGLAVPNETQIVIRPEGVQATGRIDFHGAMLNIQIEAIPSVKDGVLMIVPTKAKLGDLPVQPLVAKLVLDKIFGRDLGKWDAAFNGHVLKDVRLEEGKLELVVK